MTINFLNSAKTDNFGDKAVNGAVTGAVSGLTGGALGVRK